MNNIIVFLHSFSQWLFTMWIINILTWLYALFVLVRYVQYICKNATHFWERKKDSIKFLQAWSWVTVLSMFIAADIWAMSFYTVHPVTAIEFFFYAFDTMVIRHLSEEIKRFNTLL